jgi:hypothetical protein
MCSTSPPTTAASSLVGYLSTAVSEHRAYSYGTPTDLVAPPPQKMGVVSRTCYNCGQVGHIVRDCIAPRQTFARHLQNHCNQSPRGPTKVVATRTSHVNYTTIEDVPEGKRLLTGIFSLNGHPVVILFDLGASHDFISKACT